MEIRAKDIGPIKEFLQGVDDCGVVVLRGKQGSGKSTILNGIRKSLGGDVRNMPVRDGAKRGSLELGDIRVTFTRARTATIGDLEVESLESRLDVTTLVDPGVADPEKADAVRIKSLVKLRNVKADPSDYYELAGGEAAFNELGVDTDTDDPVLLAKRVKAAFDARARAKERAADDLFSKASTLGERLDGVDLMPPESDEVLRSQLDKATSELGRLEGAREASNAAKAKVSEASSVLAEMESFDFTQLNELISTTTGAINETNEEIRKLESQLDEIQSKLEVEHKMKATAERELEMLQAEHKTRTEADAERTALMAVIDAGVPNGPSDDELESARKAKSDALDRLAKADTMRELIKFEDQRKQYDEAGKELRREGERLRDRGRDNDNVLADLVPLGDLRIEGGRLVTKTDRSDSEPYAELSHGERWKIAIDLAAAELARAERPGMLVIPQEAWEGLQPSNQKLIEDFAKGNDVLIWTARVSDGELEVEGVA